MKNLTGLSKNCMLAGFGSNTLGEVVGKNGTERNYLRWWRGHLLFTTSYYAANERGFSALPPTNRGRMPMRGTDQCLHSVHSALLRTKACPVHVVSWSFS